MSPPTMLPLACPGCGEGLRGLHQDVVFACRGCGRFLEVAGDRFVERTGAMAVSARSTAAAFHLPVWAFRVQARCAWPDAKREAEASLIPPADWVYVTAFSLHNPSYFGDPGLIFTEKRVQLGPAEARAPLFGCVRSLEAAAAFVESHLLTILDRRVDVTGLRLTCIIEEARVWGVPFTEAGEAVEDGILGLRLPAAAVNDLAALRALVQKR